MLHYQILVSIMHGKIKKIIKNNIFNISDLTCSETFFLPHKSFSLPDIQDHIEYIIKIHKKLLIIF